MNKTTEIAFASGASDFLKADAGDRRYLVLNAPGKKNFKFYDYQRSLLRHMSRTLGIAIAPRPNVQRSASARGNKRAKMILMKDNRPLRQWSSAAESIKALNEHTRGLFASVTAAHMLKLNSEFIAAALGARVPTRIEIFDEVTPWPNTTHITPTKEI